MPSAARAQLQRQANTTLTLPADLPSATGYTTANALGSLTFSNPIAVRAQPGNANRLFVVERNGTIQLVDLSASPMTKTLFLNLAAYLTAQGTPLRTDGECGFLSMEFHPNFAQNGYFYVFYSFNSAHGQLHERVARFTVNGTPATATSADTSTHLPLITQYDGATNHNGGDLHFGPADGYLYISVGDEGNANDSFDNARHINKDFFGAILRIDVDNKPGSLAPNPHTQAQSTDYPSAINPGTYSIPPDNPFIGATSHHHETFAANTVRTEIWATGLRNPFRFSFDPPTGRLFAGDVGQNAWEEVDILTAGSDSGWSVYEGNHQGPNYDATLPISSFLFPIYDYPHDGVDDAHYSANFRGNVITGGVIYRGPQFTELYENYIFCDEGSGNIWALQPPAGAGAWTVKRLGSNSAVVAFGTDPRNGDLLLVDITGQVKHLVRSGTTGTPPPALLSQTGAFSDLATLTPNTGIVPYTPNVSFWSDYAQKSRWFSIKNLTDKMVFSADGNWTLPTGQVWVKHFDLPLERSNPNGASRRIETRFLVKTASNVYGITYKWRSDNSDADLVAESGEDVTYPITINGNPATQTWHYPSRNECLTCHTPVAGGALSFNTRQLNASHVYGAQTQNQIQALSNAGYFTAAVSGVNNLPRFFRSDETSQSYEARARSYFAVNCVQCHQPGGAALGNWDARPTTPTDSANMINGALVDQLGDSANRFVKPNDLAHSVAFRRVRGTDAPRMPPLATNERDLDAEALLSAWIQTELPTRRSFADFQVQYFGSTTNPNAAANVDFDGDGRTNLQEWLENTDPTNAASAWNFTSVASAGGGFQLQFTQPANRSALVEISPDLATWSLWDVPGNQPTYPATAQPIVMTSPFDADKKFFRVRLSAP